MTKAKSIRVIRPLNKDELLQFNELNRIATAEKFKATQILGNTALVPDGQKVGEIQQAIANLMENTRINETARILIDCGVEKNKSVKINNETGKITVLEQVAKKSKK